MTSSSNPADSALPPCPAGPLCTQTGLAADLRRLGLRKGDVVLVHTSLRRIGWVPGGAEAVVRALLDVLRSDGSENESSLSTAASTASAAASRADSGAGTLVVPTQSTDNSDPAEWRNPPVPADWWDAIRAHTPAYDPATTRTRGVGVLPETVRTWPGMVRSAHPQTSFAAVGPHASKLMAHHALNCRLGEQSPLAQLEAANARVLLLGAGYDTCTSFHLAEYRVAPPPARCKNSFAAITPQGRQWLTVDDYETDEDRFDELGAAFERDCKVIRGKVGAADARLFSLRDAVGYAQEWLQVHRPNKTASTL